jgi:hypothetical protein
MVPSPVPVINRYARNEVLAAERWQIAFGFSAGAFSEVNLCNTYCGEETRLNWY